MKGQFYGPNPLRWVARRGEFRSGRECKSRYQGVPAEQVLPVRVAHKVAKTR